MAQIILDFGSGNTCKNDFDYIKRMVESVAEIDHHKHEVIIKWQLFTVAPPSGGGTIAGTDIPLKHRSFAYAYEYAAEKGYRTTASVFDRESLAFLLGFDVPFVKIACRASVRYLANEIPRRIPVYMSVTPDEKSLITSSNGFVTDLQRIYDSTFLMCVASYPASLSQYPDYGAGEVSDHVSEGNGLALWYRSKPSIWEKHFVLERDHANPDAGPFSLTPDQLKEIL